MDDEPTASSSSSEGRNCKPVTQGWETTPPSQNLDHAAQLAFAPKHVAIGSLAQPVIHIQSPTIRTTYIQSGSLSQPLGIELPWFGIQLRRSGGREVSLEVGVVDTQGNEGRIRFSSFQTTPTVRFSETHPPILHIPLKFPIDAPLTPWLSLHLNLTSLLPLFHSSALTLSNNPVSHRPLPKKYASTTYIRVYANCRVKRVWMSARADAVERGGEAVKDEWGMYSRGL
ncbi:hypothetical protein QFC20_007250 [Naganishia adeliensis]|uniref:Uncharacterized protein n=1 Tax=Naganishia adeliensis TaxID=92952 RepID=A0ACC2V1I6_9TREE|nr:hypothetical protein QFC20_007250 [Naganishia adeliensis]